MLSVAACGGATPVASTAPAVIASPDAAIVIDASPDASPDAPIDAESVGAMPVPPADDADAGDADDPWTHATLDEVDTTVSLDDVKSVKGPWPVVKHLKMHGRVMLAMHAENDGMLRLAVIEIDGGDDDAGLRDDLDVAPVIPEHFAHAFDGDAYLPRQRDGETGPILFAARVLPASGGERTQIVVFSDGAQVRVVAKPLSAKTWKPLMLIAFRQGATFVGIGTTDPH